MKIFSVGLGILAAMACAGAQLAEPPSKDMRIAIRYGYGDVLIVGGKCTADPKGLKRVEYRVPLMPARRVFLPTPEFLASGRQSTPEPHTEWKAGDHWQVYTGSGAPVTVVVDRIVLFEFAHQYHDGVIAHIMDPEGANRITGLLATVYLASPGNGLTGVSQTPLLPEHNSGYTPDEDSGRIIGVLVRAAHKVLHDKNWRLEHIETELVKNKVLELNTMFIENKDEVSFPNESRILRWALPDQQPLLFVQLMWSRYEGPPLFAADVVMERNTLKILSFDTTPAEEMRTDAALFPNCTAGSFKCPPTVYSVMLDPVNRFLNVWKIGTRTFVLTYTGYNSDFSVNLQELRSDKGLIPTSLAYSVNEN